MTTPRHFMHPASIACRAALEGHRDLKQRAEVDVPTCGFADSRKDRTFETRR